MSAVELKDSTALNAAVDPKLMRLMTAVKRKVKMMELTGICHLG